MNETSEHIQIQGMGCEHCVTAVRRVLNEVSGVEVEEVRIGSARLRFDSSRTPFSEIESAIREAGYSIVHRDR